MKGFYSTAKQYVSTKATSFMDKAKDYKTTVLNKLDDLANVMTPMNQGFQPAYVEGKNHNNLYKNRKEKPVISNISYIKGSKKNNGTGAVKPWESKEKKKIERKLGKYENPKDIPDSLVTKARKLGISII